MRTNDTHGPAAENLDFLEDTQEIDMTTVMEESDMTNGIQTHTDIPEIPEGVELPDSLGSLIPDEETPEQITYDDEEDE